MKWINVNDKMPIRGERVLMCVNGVSVFEGYTNKYDEWKRNGNHIKFCFGDYGIVTHWMPMPKFPTEREDKNDDKELR